MASRDSYVLGFVAVAIMAAYSFTLSPSIAGGDSGEIVAEGCQMGIAHPPGYPLITMILHLIYRLPTSASVAYRANSFCALCTVVASFLVGKTVIALAAPSTPSPSPEGASSTVDTAPRVTPTVGAALAMVSFAFSPLIWQYAISAEVFPLNTFFAALIVYLTVSFSKSPSKGKAVLGAFVCGLALCNQHTIILYEAPLILWMLFLMRRVLVKDLPLLGQLAAAFLVGLVPYAYLPLSALHNSKPGSWGDVSHVAGFIHHFLRRDYGTFQLFSGAAGQQTENLWERNASYVVDIWTQQCLPIGVALALLGIIAPLGLGQRRPETRAKPQPKSKKASAGGGGGGGGNTLHSPSNVSMDLDVSANESTWVTWVLVTTQLFYFLVFHSLSNLPLSDKLLYGVHQRFWMQPNVVLFVWVGVGYSALSRWILSKTSSRVLSLVYLVAAVLGYAQFHRSFSMNNQRDAHYFNQYARAVLDPLPQNAVLLINYDQQWTSVRYMQLCEGFRTDVTALQLSMMTYRWFKSKRHLYPHLAFPGSYLSYQRSPLLAADKAFTLYQFLQANTDKQIFLGGKLSFPDDNVAKAYDMEPRGLVSRFTPMASVPNGTEYSALSRTAWRTVLSQLPALPDPTKYSEVTWEWTIGRDFKDRIGDTSAFLLLTAIPSAASDPRSLAEALYWLETSIYLEGGIALAPHSLLKNAGLGHIHLIQNKALEDSRPLPPIDDIHESFQAIGWPALGGWHQWCSDRFMVLWKEFLSRPEASADTQYKTIKAMYEKVLAAMSKKAAPPQ